MSCYAHREDPRRFVKIFAEPSSRSSDAAAFPLIFVLAITKAARSARGGMRLCSRPSLDLPVDEMHLEMASREFSEIESDSRDRGTRN